MLVLAFWTLVIKTKMKDYETYDFKFSIDGIGKKISKTGFVLCTIACF